MARDVSFAVRARVEKWARATGASVEAAWDRLGDAPMHDYDGVDDFFADQARYVPEAAEIRDWWDRVHASERDAEVRAEAFQADRTPQESRDNVRRAGDVWVVRLSPEEASVFERARKATPYTRSEFIRAGMAVLARTVGEYDPRAEVLGEPKGAGA